MVAFEKSVLKAHKMLIASESEDVLIVKHADYIPELPEKRPSCDKQCERKDIKASRHSRFEYKVSFNKRTGHWDCD